LEAIRVKVLVLVSIFSPHSLPQADDNNHIQNVKVELTSENDLFFHYTHLVDEDSFR
jgi:hypothetical protein